MYPTNLMTSCSSSSSHSLSSIQQQVQQVPYQPICPSSIVGGQSSGQLVSSSSSNDFGYDASSSSSSSSRRRFSRDSYRFNPPATSASASGGGSGGTVSFYQSGVSGGRVLPITTTRGGGCCYGSPIGSPLSKPTNMDVMFRPPHQRLIPPLSRPPPPPPEPSQRAPDQRIQDDYNQNFVDTGERPQNNIGNTETNLELRFDGYPKLMQLMQRKRELITTREKQGQYIIADLHQYDLPQIGTRFDLIYIDPPWKEYYQRVGGGDRDDLKPWTLDDLKALKIKEIGDTPSVLFLWCGANHLDEGRELLYSWEYKRCEDICWLKTNKKRMTQRNQGQRQTKPAVLHLHDDQSILQRTKEHCLMGIKGTVKRSSDTHFIHTNLDTDVLVDEEPDDIGSTAKPFEMYDIMERFCLGRRRLELFGTERNIRNGWLTIGLESENKILNVNRFNRDNYLSQFRELPGQGPGPLIFHDLKEAEKAGGRYLGTTPEIETLRPKSPPRQTRVDPDGSLSDYSDTGSRPDSRASSIMEWNRKNLKPSDVGEVRTQSN